MRRSSLANPADIVAARKRSMTPGGITTPERRSVSGPSQVNPASLPNRKALVAEPEELRHVRRDEVEPKMLPVNLPNRKAFIAPSPQTLEQRDAVPPKVLPVHLPIRKAFIAPQEGEHEKRDTPAPNVLPSSLPNRKAYVAPEGQDAEIKISMQDIPSFSTYTFPATPAAEKRDFDPFFVPNRKAFIHADPAKIEQAASRIASKPYTFPPAPLNRRTYDPASLPNRKAFIHPDELKMEGLSVEEEGVVSAPPSAEALAPSRRSLDPASLPNRKAFIHPDEAKLDVKDKHEDDESPSPVALRRSRRSLDPASLPNRKAFIAAPSIEVIEDTEAEVAEPADEASTSQSTQETGTAIPLFKRAGAPLKTEGVVDMDKAQVSAAPASLQHK